MEAVYDQLLEAALEDWSELPLPAAPTITVPGSKSRIKIMHLRYMRGEQVFHPSDVRWEAIDHIGRKVSTKLKKNGAKVQEKLVYLRKG